MSRTALDGHPLGGVEKDELLAIIKRFTSTYFTEVLGFCLMGNHFHLLVRMLPAAQSDDASVERRFKLLYEAVEKQPQRTRIRIIVNSTK